MNDNQKTSDARINAVGAFRGCFLGVIDCVSLKKVLNLSVLKIVRIPVAEERSILSNSDVKTQGCL
jgi:hypothetical protein